MAHSLLVSFSPATSESMTATFRNSKPREFQLYHFRTFSNIYKNYNVKHIFPSKIDRDKERIFDNMQLFQNSKLSIDSIQKGSNSNSSLSICYWLEEKGHVNGTVTSLVVAWRHAWLRELAMKLRPGKNQQYLSR